MTSVFVSPKHRAVVVPRSEAVGNMFPDAKTLELHGQDMLVLPYRPTEAFVLKQLGYEVDAPILHTYDWPGSFKPFDVQRKTCAMLSMNKRAYVLNGMGTGKTKSALWAWDYLYSNGSAKKLLILAPLSTLKFTWGREVFNTLPHRTYAVLHGTRKKRLEALKADVDVFICNHDGFKIIQPEVEKMIAAGVLDTLVIDELSVYRNASAERTKGMIKFAPKMQIVWGMTGSPMPNEPTDVWAPARIITPDTVPQHFRRYRDSLMLQINQFKYVPKQDATERAFQALQPAVRFTLDDVVELPELIEQDVDIDMGPKQTLIYKELATTCYTMVSQNKITAVNAGALLMKLLQVSTGWVYDQNHNVVTLDGDGRISALLDAIDASDRKVLVFTPFKHSLAGLSAALAKHGVEHATVSGDTNATERGEIFNLFENTNKYKAIVAHPATMAHGLTLNAASTTAWFAPITSLEIFEQANARNRRVGQQGRQLRLFFSGSPVERKLYTMLRKRQSVQDGFLELFEEATRLST